MISSDSTIVFSLRQSSPTQRQSFVLSLLIIYGMLFSRKSNSGFSHTVLLKFGGTSLLNRNLVTSLSSQLIPFVLSQFSLPLANGWSVFLWLSKLLRQSQFKYWLACIASAFQLKFYLALDMGSLLGAENVPRAEITHSRRILEIFLQSLTKAFWHHLALRIGHGVLWSDRDTCCN